MTPDQQDRSSDQGGDVPPASLRDDFENVQVHAVKETVSAEKHKTSVYNQCRIFKQFPPLFS
jgi:hypothetical protein